MLTRKGSTGHGQLGHGPSQESPRPPNVGSALGAGQMGTKEAQVSLGPRAQMQILVELNGP